MGAPPHLLFFLFLLFRLAAALAADAPEPSQPPPPPPPPPKVRLWPKPSSISLSSAVYAQLSPSFSIRASPSHSSLRHAIAFYSRLIKAERHLPLVPPSNYTLSTVPIRLLALSVSDLHVPLGPGVDESYTLSVTPNSPSADISAATSWGAIRGLETFSQLAWAGGGPETGGQPVVPSDIEISDRPLFAHRGVLLDTARNYYPVPDILRTIRAMAFNKLNVFHWHITDSQSFPIVLPTVPSLANAGAYSPAMRYTAADVSRIVRYAEAFGIRVIPEVDMPGE
jgi:hexosaminidase